LDRTTGLHPPSYPSPDPGADSRTTRGARRHLEACPPEALWAAGCRGSNQTHIHAALEGLAQTKIRSSPVYAGHTIKPLKNTKFIAGACSLGQDRGRRSNRRPLPDSTETKFPLPFERALRSSGKEHSPIVSAFWNASTDAPATASTSGRRLFIRFPSACQEQKSGRGGGGRRPENPNDPALLC